MAGEWGGRVVIGLTITPRQEEPARGCQPVPALSPGLGMGPKFQPDMMGQGAPESGCQSGLSARVFIEAQASQLLCTIYIYIYGETEAPEGARGNL